MCDKQRSATRRHTLISTSLALTCMIHCHTWKFNVDSALLVLIVLMKNLMYALSEKEIIQNEMIQDGG